MRCAACRWLHEKVLTLVNKIDGISFFLEFVIGHDEMLEEGAPLASHVLYQVLRHEAKIFLDLLDQPIAIFEIQMPKA